MLWSLFAALLALIFQQALPGATLTGRVLNSDGSPMVRSQVTLLSVGYRDGRRTLLRVAGSGMITYTQTDDQGRYRLSGIRPGSYYLRIDNHQPASAANPPRPRSAYYPGVRNAAGAATIQVQGQDLALADIRLSSGQLFRISGRITPLPGDGSSVSLYLSSADPDSLEEPVFVPTEQKESVDGNESFFEIDGISPGVYALYAISDEAGVFGKTVAKVEDSNVDGLRIVPKVPSKLQGRVSVKGDPLSTSMGAIEISLDPKDRVPSSLRMNSVAANPDPATGEFAIEETVEDTRYAIRVTGLPPDAYVADVRHGNRSVFDDGFVLASGSVEPFEVELGTKGGIIGGIVRDTLDRPAARVAVLLVPVLPRRNNSLLYKRRATTVDGEFNFRGIAPGDYELFAFSAPPPIGAEEDPIFLSQYEGQGTAVKVQAAGATQTQLRVIPFR